MAQDVHHQLRVLSEGKFEPIGSVRFRRPHLVGVPVLVLDPARFVWRKSQDRPVGRHARKYPVSRRKERFEVGLRNLLDRPICQAQALDGVEREASQPVAQVTPPIEVPRAPIVNQPLRGHVPRCGAVLSPMVMLDLDALSLEDGLGGETKRPR